ncbi:MAG: phage tail tape measure protein [Bacillota bacterium]
MFSQELGEAVVPIRAAMDGLKADLEEAHRTVSESLRKAGDNARGVGERITTGITLPLAGAAAGAFKMSTDFNAAMANVGSLIPGNTKRVIELKESIQDMAVETGKATGDLAGGLYQVISAFGDTADTAKILEINAKAAAAGVASTTDAINLTSAVTKGYGDTSAAAVQQVSDLALQTVKLGQTTFPELAGSIGRVTPLAASLGVSVQELFAAMATGTGVTGGAAEVSTQLRGVLQSLMAPTDSMNVLLMELGFESGEAMIQQLGLKGTIETIVRAAKDAGHPLQAYIGSIEGQTLALALAGPQADAFAQKLQAMDQAAGATDAAFKEQTEGVNAGGFAWTQFRREVENTAIDLGDSLAPALKEVLDTLRPVIDVVSDGAKWFSELDPKIQTAIIVVAGIAAALGPLLIVLGAVTSGIGALSTILGPATVAIGALTGFGGTLATAFSLWAGGAATFGEALTFALGPVGLIVLAIAAAVAVGVLLYKNWDTISAWLSTTWNAIAETAAGIWTSIKETAAAIWDGIKEFFAKWWETLLVVFTGPIGIIALLVIKNWDKIKETTSEVWNAVTEFISGIWESISAKATEVFTAVSDFLHGVWEDVKSFLGGIWDGIATAFDNTFGDMVRSAFDFGKRIMQALKDAIGSVKIPIPSISLSFREGPLGIQIPDLDFGVNWRALKDLVPFLAEGGIVTAPTLAMIGEAGPEAVVPLSQLGLAGAGGPTIVVTGNTFMSEYDMERFINQKLMPAVQRVFELRGPYRG